MKEVTICFSFLVRDGVLNSLSTPSGILHGLFTDGIVTIKKHKLESEEGLKLLAQIGLLIMKSDMQRITLWERKLINTLDDLEAKKTTHAKGDKP